MGTTKQIKRNIAFTYLIRSQSGCSYGVGGTSVCGLAKGSGDELRHGGIGPGGVDHFFVGRPPFRPRGRRGRPRVGLRRSGRPKGRVPRRRQHCRRPRRKTNLWSANGGSRHCGACTPVCRCHSSQAQQLLGDYSNGAGLLHPRGTKVEAGGGASRPQHWGNGMRFGDRYRGGRSLRGGRATGYGSGRAGVIGCGGSGTGAGKAFETLGL